MCCCGCWRCRARPILSRPGQHCGTRTSHRNIRYPRGSVIDSAEGVVLAHDWDKSWAVLEPALQSLLGSVLDRFPRLSGHVTRTSYGEVYFGAGVYLMGDPVGDEHELLIVEVEVRSDVGPRDTPPHLEFNPADPGLVVLDIWSPEKGSVLKVERAIPSGATAADIERVTSAFFGDVVASMPQRTTLVLDALQERLGE